MSGIQLVSLTNPKRVNKSHRVEGKILLVKPPYFSPWTPPLGIALLKAFLEQHGYSVRCLDFNTDPELWGMHHKYFATLQTLEDISTNDGYSKLWWILNAHMLAYANTTDAIACSKVLEEIIPLYGIRCNRKVIKALLPLVEQFFGRLDELTNRLDLSSFSFIGTSTYSTSLAASLYLLKLVKQKHPLVTTVMGGGVFADDLALGSDNLETLIREYDYVDHVILGEGELLMLKLLQGELSNKRVISLADLQGETLAIRDVPLPDFSDIDLESYYHLSIEGARSCPFQCNFCSETVQWGDYRKRPIDLFAQQTIELARRYGNNSFFMGDSLMNPYIIQFSQELLAKKANILYDGYLRADKPVTYRHNVKLWAQSGCYRVRLGIESAAARVLDSMNKMTKPKVISDVLKTLASAGIRTTTYWIVGFPGETEEDFQETCDFIREHHHYIYELEAHPYYYYPYGQIGSRLFQCYSLYPEDITNITKFKVWEIADVNPGRDERYRRLRRISELATRLRLPNIYTMAERYQAEARWHSLNPLSIEVYEGTRVCRGEAQLLDHSVELLPNTQHWFSELANAGKSVISCYEVSVKKLLQIDTLTSAVTHLIYYNEMLQMRLEGNQYVPMPASKGQEYKLLSVYHNAMVDREREHRIKQEIIERISAELKPEPGRSIHFALLNWGEVAGTLLLLAHPAIADSRSMILLLEDLYRLYEQLSNERPISLRLARKSYPDFAGEMTAYCNSRKDPSVNGVGPRFNAGLLIDNQAREAAEPESPTVESIAIIVGKEVVSRMASEIFTEYGLKITEVFILALLRSLARTCKVENVKIHTVHDFRSYDPDLEFTVGPLTGLCQLTMGVIESDNLLANLHELRRVLAEFDAGRRVSGSNLSSRLPPATGILLNLEYLNARPWMGSDEWVPEGFVINEDELRGDYAMQFVPIPLRDEVQLWLTYRNTEQVKKFLGEIGCALATEVKAVVDYFECYVSALAFWSEEFNREAPESNLALESDRKHTTGAGQGWTNAAIEKDSVNLLRDECRVDVSTVLLAGYSAVLSRLNGREAIDLLCHITDSRGTKIVPLRLYPYWNLSFRELVQRVAQKLELAATHSVYGFDALNNKTPGSERDHPFPVFDVGYIFTRCAGAGQGTPIFNDLSERFDPYHRRFDLILEAAQDGEDLTIRLAYEGSRCREEMAAKLAAYLRVLLTEAANEPGAQLGYISLDSDLVAGDEVNSIVQAAFHF